MNEFLIFFPNRAIEFSGTLAVQRAKDMRYMKKINSKNWIKLGLNNNRLFKSRGRSDQ